MHHNVEIGHICIYTEPASLLTLQRNRSVKGHVFETLLFIIYKQISTPYNYTCLMCIISTVHPS